MNKGAGNAPKKGSYNQVLKNTRNKSSKKQENAKDYKDIDNFPTYQKNMNKIKNEKSNIFEQ